MGNQALDELRRLTPALPDLILSRGEGSYVDYDVEGGSCFGISLLHRPGVAAQVTFMSQGCRFPQHDHEADEYLIVYEGKLRMDTPGQKEVGVGGFLHFPPGVVHSVTAVEDTRMVAVTVPAEKGYPHG